MSVTIQERVDYITRFAYELTKCKSEPEYLFSRVNSIHGDDIHSLLEQYSEDNIFGNATLSPVNFIRHHILHMLESGKKITADELENAKEKFIAKDMVYFSGYGEPIRKAIEDYLIGDRTPFHVWKEPFRILYAFIFTKKIKETVNDYLKGITNEIIEKVGMKNFLAHWVNFDGSNNFGSDYCWFSLFPADKLRHTNAVQLHASLTADGIKYGLYQGDDIKRFRNINDADVNYELLPSKTIDVVLEFFKSKLDTVIILNKSIKQFWKYAPGEQGKYWDEMKQEGIMAVGFSELKHLDNYPDAKAISEAMKANTTDNRVTNIDQFRNASIGDIVIANKGTKGVLGIGIIMGMYEYDESREHYKHFRKVEWGITDYVESENILFRRDTFSPTLNYSKVKNLYLKKDAHYKEFFDKIDGGRNIPIIEGEHEREEETDINYFWLNANPKIWNYSDLNVGETQTYTTQNERGNKRRIYDHFLRVNPGDKVIGYVSSPVRQVTTLLEVSRKLFTNEQEGEVVEFKIGEFLENPVDFEVLKESKLLQTSEPFINNLQGSLFALKKEEYDAILEIVSSFSPARSTSQAKEKYSLLDVANETGIAEEILEKYKAIVTNKRQVIFQGPPGTGKTYVAERFAHALCKSRANIEIIQFHPSYSYEDFVEGYRPIESGGLKVKSGIFKEICRRAEINKGEIFALIIDEINRGDVSKIFGELIYLLEYRDKKVRLTYNPELTFQIPSNLYIIGTMNLADRSLSLIDYALRRRFSFITLETDYDLITRCNEGSELDIRKVVANIREVNKQIAETHSLGSNFIIGHSYFIGKPDKPLKMKTKEDLEWLWEYDLKPLLSEYYFDKTDNVKNLEAVFFKDVKD
ncbi:MAG: AAA family ATPase [Syntrophales bacterium]